MNKYSIKIEIKIQSLIEKILKVDLSIYNCENHNVIKLYKGKINFLDINCNCPYTEDNHFIYVDSSTKDILNLTYNVKIGNLAKHGCYGEVSDDLIIFAGEQVLLLPAEVLTTDNILPSNRVENIEINYNFSQEFNSVIPFKFNNNHSSFLKSPKWCHIYELMKSSYAFSKFNIYNCNDHLNIFIDNKLTYIKESTLKEINKLYGFYSNLFNNSISLSIILLNDNDGTGILGGCGRSIIGATFKENDLRDWQLLSHRIFHSFMDYTLPISDFHMPPNLWLTEGLATYYENIALDSLSNDLKEELEINSSKEFTKLFNRYLYMSLKEPTRLAIPPMNEMNLNSHGKSEFLHYTQAPLIVHLIENICSSKNNTKDNIIQAMLSLNLNEEFSLRDLFFNLLGNNLNTFAMKYLFNCELLPLWYLKDNNCNNSTDIISDLNYYEYVLATWLCSEDNYYVQDELSGEKLNKICYIAEKTNSNFNIPLVEYQIKNYSNTIYALLKQYALRAKVCKLRYNDEFLRYDLLMNPQYLKVWNEFISNNI